MTNDDLSLQEIRELASESLLKGLGEEFFNRLSPNELSIRIETFTLGYLEALRPDSPKKIRRDIPNNPPEFDSLPDMVRDRFFKEKK